MTCDCVNFAPDPNAWGYEDDEPVCYCGHTFDEHDQWSGVCQVLVDVVDL